MNGGDTTFQQVTDKLFRQFQPLQLPFQLLGCCRCAGRLSLCRFRLGCLFRTLFQLLPLPLHILRNLCRLEGLALQIVQQDGNAVFTGNLPAGTGAAKNRRISGEIHRGLVCAFSAALACSKKQGIVFAAEMRLKSADAGNSLCVGKCRGIRCHGANPLERHAFCTSH